MSKATGKLTSSELNRRFRTHLRGNVLVALGMLAISLAIGMIGYHALARLNWVDSFMNASMILGGMGPVDPLPTDGAKIFAGVYALYSGVVFIATAGLIIAPVGTHVLHKFHMDDKSDKSN